MQRAIPRTIRITPVLAGIALLAACSGGTGGQAAAGGPSGPPRPGGTLTFATDKEPDCYDPQVSPADITGAVTRNVYDSLVAETPQGEFKPWLATSWTISPDGKTYTFDLRDDVTFTDGTPFDGAAVKANFDRIVDPRTKSQYAGTLLGPYDETVVKDPHTVEVRFSTPYAPFLHAASTSNLGFHSPRSIQAHPEGLCQGGPTGVGTGPFTFSGYTRGQQAEFTKNPAYGWAPGTAQHQGAAYLDKVVVRFLPDGTVRTGAVRSGQVDVADAVPASSIAALERDSSLRLLATDSRGLPYTYFFNTSKAPFSDERVRRAVQQSVDLDSITKAVYFGHYPRSWGLLSPATPGYDADLQGKLRFDPAGAARLLDEAGWTTKDGEGYRTKDGERLELTLLFVPEYTSPDRADLDQAFQASLKKAGIAVDLVPMDSGSYTPRRNAGGYDTIAFAWGGAEPDLLRTLFAGDNQFTEGGANAARLKDAQVDTWLREAAETTDRTARDTLYAQVQQRLLDTGVALPTAVQRRTLALGTKVQGVRFDANAWPIFADAWVSGT